MLPLARELGAKGFLLRPLGPLRCAIWLGPYGASTIAVFGLGADGVTSLEREVWLDVVDGRIVVVLYLAELKEAVGTRPSLSRLISEQRPR